MIEADQSNAQRGGKGLAIIVLVFIVAMVVAFLAAYWDRGRQ